MGAFTGAEAQEAKKIAVWLNVIWLRIHSMSPNIRRMLVYLLEREVEDEDMHSEERKVSGSAFYDHDRLPQA